MKKRFFVIIVSLLTAGLLITGCSTGKTTAATGAQAPAGEATIKVGAAVVPHSEILNFIKPKLKEKGVNLEIVTLDDEAQLNPALAQNQIDANYFQHVPYLEQVAKEKGYNFSVLAKVHVEPMGFYSQKIRSLDQLKDGAKIAIPDNPSNEYRALALFEAKGLIKLRSGIADFKATPKDIVENPKKLQFVEVDAAQLTRTLPDVDGAVINTNRVLEAKIDPKTALFREDAKSAYGNVVVVRKGDETKDSFKKLAEALTSPEVKKFIEDKYGVAVVPAF